MKSIVVRADNIASEVAAECGLALACLVYGVALAWAIIHEQWLVCTAMFALPVAIWRPVECSLGLFAALVPFERVAAISDNYNAGNTVNWFVGAAGGALLLLSALAGGRLMVPPKTAVWWSALIVWACIVTTWAYDPQAAFGRLPTAITIVAFYVAAVSVRIHKRELFHICVLTVLGGMVAAVLTAKSYYGGLRWVGDVQRASLVIGDQITDPNVLAASQLLPFALALAMIASSRQRIAKVASGVALAVITHGLLLTMSRGGLIAICTIILVFVRYYRVNWRMVLAVGLLPVFVLIIPGHFLARIEDSLSSHGGGRFDIWRAGLHALGDWYWGAGLENFSIVYRHYAGHARRFAGYDTQAHNLYLSTVVDLGVVGLALLMGAIISQLRVGHEFCSARGQVEFPIGIACLAACCGMVVMGMSLEILWLKSFWLCWILLAVAARTWHNEQTPRAA